jgi:hypothetical protein
MRIGGSPGSGLERAKGFETVYGWHFRGWNNESCLAARAKRGSREKFLQALDQVADVEPPEWIS